MGCLVMNMNTPSTRKRALLYCRVSTEDQRMDAQQMELRGYCAGRGWEVVGELMDKMSGGSIRRDGLEKVLGMVREKAVDAVVVVKIDRLARSLAHFTRLVEEFERCGVALVATSQGIDTSRENPAGQLQMNVLAAVAQFERSLISERTKAGLAAVKAGGKQLGHPSKVLPAEPERTRIVKGWLEETGGIGIRELARRLGGCALSTARDLALRAQAGTAGR